MDRVHLHLNIQAYLMFPYQVVNMYNIAIHIDLIVEFYSDVFPIKKNHFFSFCCCEIMFFCFVYTIDVASHSSLLSISVSIS